MPINTHHADYDKWALIWEKIEDAIDGQDSVKRKTEKYLPRLPGQTDDKDTGYQSYLSRAVYENFCGRTLNISLGQLFRKKPVISGVDQSILDNIDLSGQNFDYFSRDLSEDIILYNRVGVLVDYSDDQKRPFLTDYDCDSIINWKHIIINGQKKLLFVILEGEVEKKNNSDPYKSECIKIWKELYLDVAYNINGKPVSGVYRVRDWIKNPDPTKAQTEPYIIVEGSDRTPIKNNKTLDSIPFYFISNSGFNPDIEASMMLDMVDLNLAHYRNSADYENMLHLTGAGTYILRGWDENKPFPIGSGAAFPEQGGAEILQGRSDSGLESGMRHKQEIMAMIGSQILSGKGRYVASAETTQTQASGEYATLADASNSLSYCMTIIMQFFVEWAGGKPDDVDVAYNTDFEVSEIPQGKLTELGAAKNSGDISPTAYRYQLRAYEFFPANWSDEDEEKDIAKYQAQKVEKRDKMINQSIANKMQNGHDQQMNNSMMQIPTEPVK